MSQDPRQSESSPAHGRRSTRDAETRGRDHDAIDRLTDVLLPDLIDRLAASGLGEIEIREDDWRIRLRRPPVPPRAAPDRATDRADRAGRPTPGSSPGADTRTQQARHETSGTSLSAAGPHRVVATSPAVGVFQPRVDVRPGSRVRAGDRLAVVDLLGLPQDVVAPEDGVVVDTLVESGEGVEYGQDLIVIEPVRGRHATDPAAAAPLMEA